MIQSIKKTAVEAVCLLQTDKQVMASAGVYLTIIKKDGLAAKHLSIFLKGEGGTVNVDLAKLLQDDTKIKNYFVTKVLIGFFEQGTTKGTVAVQQSAYSNLDWLYAIGAIAINYDIKSYDKDKGSLKVQIEFKDTYDWHPEKEATIQCVHEAADRLLKEGAREFEMKGSALVEIPIKLTPIPFSASNFKGKTIHAARAFFPALERINGYARNRKVNLVITDSFRLDGKAVPGAIVTPSSCSNHFVGHAIDFNIEFNKILYNSKSLFRSNLKNLPKDIQQFIDDIRKDKSLRWGGDFNAQDPIHIDIPLNINQKELWDLLYKAFQ